MIEVIKRDGTLTQYNKKKITAAVAAAAEEINHPDQEISKTISTLVDAELQKRAETKTNLKIHVESIQDMVELAMMRAEEKKLFLAYSEYRNKRSQIRPSYNINFNVISSTGTISFATALKKILSPLNKLVNTQQITEEIKPAVYADMPFGELAEIILLNVRNNIEKHTNYSIAAAKILEAIIADEVAKTLGKTNFSFENYVEHGIKHGNLDPKLKEFDLKTLAQVLSSATKHNFTYLGLQTLYDRYLLKDYSGNLFEMPEWMFMRVAMGLAINEQNKTENAVRFFQVMANFSYMCSTPTLFNSGTTHPQLSSCYLTTVPDNLDGIFTSIKENAMLSKYAGGLGNDWSRIRGMGATIKGTNGESQGVIPFLKIVNDTAVAVNQGGKRKGAVCAYLETWHIDIEEFLELRKNTGDERRRTHDMNTANWIPDLFMERVKNNAQWTLFSPDETPDLHDLYGEPFKKQYQKYEKLAQQGKIKNFKTVQAKQLWRKMLSMLFETGHPWITFKDPCNLAYNNNHAGVVHSSNLCTEITLHTNDNEIAVCNLGSINLAKHLGNAPYSSGNLDKAFNLQKLEDTVKIAIRMLDNVIDYNFYALEKAAGSNKKHRPIGLGIMGFQETLQRLGIPFDSETAIELAGDVAEFISFHAFSASADLAKERGAYESYKGSLRDQGILPQDIHDEILKARNEQPLRKDKMDWTPVREKIKSYGLRNSNIMAIAPTATIANICGTTQSIEPNYQNLFVKSNLSGEFTVINPVLVEYLEQKGLWDNNIIQYLKDNEGSLANHPNLNTREKEVFKTAFEIDPKAIIDAASVRQRYIDQAISLNLYLKNPSGHLVENTYMRAWEKGLKTTYYLRTLGATSVREETQQKNESITCSLEPDCEVCQ